HRHHRRLARQGNAAVDVPARAAHRHRLEREQQRREHVQDDPGAAVRRLLVAPVRDRPGAETLMDGLKAALVLFIASLLQLSVLTEYRSLRTASVVLHALPLGLLLNLLLTLPVYGLIRRLFPPVVIGDRVREVRLLG